MEGPYFGDQSLSSLYLIGSLIVAVVIFFASVGCHCSHCGRLEGEKIEDLIGSEQILYRGGLNSQWDTWRWLSIGFQVPLSLCSVLAVCDEYCHCELNPLFCCYVCCLPGCLAGGLAAVAVYSPFRNMRLKERKSFTLAVTPTNLCVSQTFEGFDSYDLSITIPIQTIHRVVDSNSCGSSGLDIYLQKPYEPSFCCPSPPPQPDFNYKYLAGREEIKKAVYNAQRQYMIQNTQDYQRQQQHHSQWQQLLQNQQQRQQQHQQQQQHPSLVNAPSQINPHFVASLSGAAKNQSINNF